VSLLSEKEERLVEAVRKLPPDAADSVVTWAERLAILAASGPIDWSDTWTEEDLADFQRASLANFDAQTD
jgi:hypothetical protein